MLWKDRLFINDDESQNTSSTFVSPKLRTNRWMGITRPFRTIWATTYDVTHSDKEPPHPPMKQTIIVQHRRRMVETKLQLL